MRNILLNTIKTITRAGAIILVLIPLAFTDGICSPTMKTATPLVVVNGDTITTDNIDLLIVKTHKNLEMSDKQSFDYDKLLTKAVNDLLITQEAYALGLDDNDYLLGILKERKKEVVRNLYLSHAFKPEIVIPEEDIRDFFEKNLIRYQFRTISVNSMDEANEIYTLLAEGKPFDSLATARSQDERRYKEGLHPTTFEMNLEPELLKISKSLQDGQYSKPIQYKHFFTIAKLEWKKPANESRYEEFRKNIVDRLTQQRKEALWYDFMVELSQKYPITADSSIIDEIRADKDVVLQMEFREGTDRPVLKYDDELYISDNQLRTEISHSIMNAGTTPFNVMLVNSINKKQEELLSLCAAFDNGYWDSTRVEKWYYSELDSAMIESYLKELIVANIKFNTEEFQAYYDANKEKFRLNDQFQLEHMMIADKDQAQKAAAALKDGAQWSYIFEQYNAKSEDSYETSNWMYVDNFLPEVVEELTNLKIGQTSSSFKGTEGFIIFKIKDRKKGGYKSIEDVDMEIREVMFQKKFNELLDEHLEKLKKNSQIVYFDKDIKKYFSNGN